MSAACVLVIYHTAAMLNPDGPTAALTGPPTLGAAFFSAFMHERRLAQLFIVCGAGAHHALCLGSF